MKIKSNSFIQSFSAYSLFSPALLLMIFFIIGPVLVVIFLSFTDWNFGSKSMNFIGFNNYINLFSDDVFKSSFTNTIVFSLLVVPASIFLGMFLAILIQSSMSLSKFYRAVYFLPVMATTVAIAIVWQFALHPSFGMVGHFLSLFGFENVDLLQNRHTALATLAAITIWQFTGFNMVLFMAGLSSIPKELYDAADVDGCNSPWQKFQLITFPMLSPVTLFVAVYTTIRSFQAFDLVKVLTQGGPGNSTEILVYTLYKEAFDFFRTGYASSIAVVFLLLILALTAIKMLYFEKKVHYQ
ncbi:carbohydrate ABC transporter permease [Sulfurospirillum sp. 1307]|jgi:multiple sugar transport system permease protein